MTKPIAHSELEALVQLAAASSNLLVLSNDMLLATFIHPREDGAGRVVNQIFGLVVGPDGSVMPNSKPFLIAEDEGASTALASVTQLDDGRVAAAWMSAHGGMQTLKARVLDINGGEIGPVVTVAQASAISDVAIKSGAAGFVIDYTRAGEDEGAIFESHAFGAGRSARKGATANQDAEERGKPVKAAAVDDSATSVERSDNASSSGESATASSFTFSASAGPGDGDPPPEVEEFPPQNIRVNGSLVLPEHSQRGTSLGQILADDESGPITYTVSGTAFAVRRIGTTDTYELVVNDPNQLNFETFPNISIFITAKDRHGNSASQEIWIRLTDELEVPTNLTLSGTRIDENAEIGTRVGNLTGISNEGGPLVWEIVSGSSAFQVVNNGTPDAYLRVIDPSALNYEGNQSHTVTVGIRARSQNGASWGYKEFTIDLNDKEEAPSNIRLLNNLGGELGVVSENIQPGQVFGYIEVDDDIGDKPTLQYTLSGQGAEYFELDRSSSGIGLKLKANMDIDYATLKHLSLTVSVTDPETNVTVPKNFSLFINSDNERPTITVAEGKEGTVASTSGQIVKPFTGVTLADPDDLDIPNLPQTQTLKISFAALRGELTGAGGATGVEVSNGNKIYTFEGTASQLQAILHNIGFDPANNNPGTTTFTLSLRDIFGEEVTNTQVHVDAISNHAPTLTIDEGREFVYLSNDEAPAPAFGNIRLSDQDNNDLVLTISFLEANGVLSGTEGGVDKGLSADGLIRTFEFHGKATDLEQLLARLKWNQNDAVFSNTRFTLSLSDGITAVTNDHRQVVINTAPTISIARGTETTPAIDNGPAVRPFSGVALNDRENDTLVVTISFTDDHGRLLDVPTGTATQVSADGTRIYTFQGTAADIGATLRGLKFDPNNGVANTTQFTISVDDGKHQAVLNEQIRVVTSTAAGNTNVAPTITVTGTGITPATDTGDPVSPFAGVIVQDAEDDVLTVTVSFEYDHGILLNSPVVATSDGSKLVYTFRGKAGDIQEILHGLRFNPHDGFANETIFTISVKDNDHQADINNQIKVVTEIAGGTSNQAPVLDVVNGTEDTTATAGSPVTPFTGIEMSDPDGDDVLVTLSFLNSHGSLGNLNIYSALYAGTQLDGDLRKYYFYGNAQEIQSYLRGLTFTPRPGSANTTNFSITIKDEKNRAVENHEIDVITSVAGGGGTNTPPEITVTPDTEVTQALDNGPVVYPFAGVHLADEDNDFLTLTISFLDAHGALGNAELGTSILGPTGLRTYTFEGRAAYLEALLHNLTFNPANDSALNGPVSTGFTITLKDDHSQAVGNSQIRVDTTHGDQDTNYAPGISVPANREITTAFDTGAPVSPFAYVDLYDGDNDVLTMTVSFREADGDLLNTDAATGMSINGETITYTFSGRADVLENILRGLQFNPEDGVVNTTTFTIGLQDTSNPLVTNSRIKVVTSLATPTTNEAPRITVAENTKVTNTTDDQPVAPFRGVDLFDQENNTLTVTVSFLHARGTLTIPSSASVSVTDNGVGSGGIHSFTLTGKADAIDLVLRAASFDPSDGTSNLTNFTISVKDAYSQAVTNRDIFVNSTAAGAPSAPTWTNDLTSISIDENSTILPFRLKATDNEGDPIHYVLVPTTGSHNHYFDLDADGQIHLAPNARLDRETTPTLDIYVRAIDSNGNESPVQKLTIRLGDVNEAPSRPYADEGYILENTTGEVTRGGDSEDPEGFGVTYRWADDVPAELQALFSLEPTEEGGFVINAVSALNHEAANLLEDGDGRYYLLKVVAEDDMGGPASAPAEIKVYVGDVNEAVTNAFFQVVPTIVENARVGTRVATVTNVEDPDLPGPNESFVFTLVRSLTDLTAYTGPFSINPNTGEITVSGTLPDVNQPTPMQLFVKVTDKAGTGYHIVKPVSFTINPVNPNNRAPTITAGDATYTIADNENDYADLVSPFAGVTIGDLDLNDTITVTITALGEYGGTFVDVLGVEHTGGTYTFTDRLQEVAGRVRSLKFNPTDRPGAPNGIDETFFRIDVEDDQGGSATLVPNIVVKSVHTTNAPPDVSVRANGSIEWTTPDNVAVQAFRDLVFTDQDTDPVTGQVTVEIVYPEGTGTLGNFIDGVDYSYDEFSGSYWVTGTLQQVNQAVAALRFLPWNRPNGEAPVTIEFLVRITDSGNARDEITVKVHATSNDAPTNIRLDGNITDTVAESLGVDQVVGELSATDENPAGVTYTFLDGFNGAGHFEIVGRQIKVKTALNFEDPITGGRGLNQEADGRKFYLLKVVATDGAGQPSAAEEIKVYIDNVNEAPVLRLVDPTEMDEDLTGGSFVADLVAEDPENDSISFSFLNGELTSPDGAFRIEGSQIIRTDVPIQVAQGGEIREYTITVRDEHGATSTSQITIHINDVGNLAPVINITGNVINEDTGYGQWAGTLSGFDPDAGDTVTEFSLDDTCGGLFTLQNVSGVWGIVINGVIDYENDPRLHEGVNDQGQTVKWYEIKVSAKDNHNLWSQPQPLKIFIQDVNPDNTAPEIRVAPNGTTHWEIGDTDTVAILRDISFFDAEDGATNPATPIVAGVDLDDITSGSLIVPPLSEFPGQFPDLEVTWDPLHPYSVWVQGPQDQVTAFLKLVQFDPWNRPSEAGTVRTSHFNITVVDSRGAYSTRTVTVAATATGEPANNAPPVIQVDPNHASTPTTDWALNPVKPFEFVTVSDANTADTLTVTVSFNRLDGTLGNAGQDGVPDGNTITYSYTGDAAAVNAWLRNLTFDATNRDAPGPDVTTRFTIAVNDGHHGLPVTNTNVTVVTTVTGPQGPDAAPTITDVADPVNANANSGTVKPFETMTIRNEDGQFTTMVIRFADANGVLGVVEGSSIVLTKEMDGADATYTFTGTAAQLNAILDDLTFDPNPIAAGGNPVDTHFTVVVTDINNTTPDIDQTGTVTVHAEYVGTPPGNITFTGTPVAENGGARVVGTLNAMDPDSTITGFTVVDTGSPFTIEQQTDGTWALKATGDLNYEGAPFHDDATGERWYEVRVTAQSGSQTSDPQVVKVYVTDVNEAPTAVNVGTLATVRSGAQAGAVVTTVSAVDPDTLNEAFRNNVFKFLLSDGTLSNESEDHFFTIDADGNVKLKADVTDTQVGRTHTFTVVAHTAGDPTQIVASQQHSVTVQAGEGTGNLPPSAPLLNGGTSVLVMENQAVVGDLNATDPNNDPLSYRIIDDPDGMFVIVGNAQDGYRLRVKAGKNLDFETRQVHTVTVEVLDGRGGTAQQTFTINVDNQDPEVNHRPTDVLLSNDAVEENSIWGTVIGTLQGVDEDTTDSLVYTLVQDDDGKFEIVDNQLRLKRGATLNFEDKPFHDIIVRVTDLNGTGLSYDKAFRINVINLSDPEAQHDPTGAFLTRNFVSENLEAGAEVGVIIGLDQDGGDILSYSIEGGGAGDRFTLSTVNGVTKLVTNQVLDYESTDTLLKTERVNGVDLKYYEVQVRVTDQTSRSKVETLKVYVNDVVDEGSLNHNPTGVTLAGNSVREHATNTVLVGELGATDVDGDVLTYRLLDDAGGRFMIANGREIRVAKGELIDFEQVRDWNITVEVSDGKGGVTTKTFGIVVRNLATESITGTALNNKFVGGTRNDKFTGMGGNDTLIGGNGNDTLDGGEGNDVFVFNLRPLATNMDKISNWNSGDKIHLTKATTAFAALAHLGALDTDAFAVMGQDTITTLTRIIYNKNTGQLFYDSNGSGSGGQVQFALMDMTSKPTLSAADFFVI